ncbi:PREDICTED: WD repeat-containing protein 44-like [Lupinus angustifolius]|uniref:WD repeat-containing protein 44-like n=1 Tax=Lupinus angustifolius TaxID=3871 RepID=UPI00092F23D6|nr:PREDICTED: WD repeat-containing protein 44-like [Lupinus angustifolius]
MGSFSGDEECEFFDAVEDIGSIADAKLDGKDNDSSAREGMSKGFDYDVWIRRPRSVRERRSRFMQRLGLGVTENGVKNSVDLGGGGGVEGEKVNNGVNGSDGAVDRNCGFQEEFCSSRSSMSCWSTMNSSEEFGLVENLPCHMDQEGQDRRMSYCGRDKDSDRSVVAEEPEDSENTFQRLASREFEEIDADALSKKSNGTGRGWLRRLQSITCIRDRQSESENVGQGDSCAFSGCRLQKVKVRQCKKQMKELSALYTRQDIQAHEGSILTMKFSPDGQYLASAGEDGVVRVWQVVVDDRCNEIDIPEIDPSCIYFTVNDLSELRPLFMDKEKLTKVKGLKKTSDSACIIFPPKIFRLLEKPLHEFHGHRGEVLDLSWSKNNYLLSSSEDKTVRLWHMKHENCLKIFSHSNYVTCIQFNPMDDNYFISGCIDGKVRIWAVPDCHVVDWIDTREIVTAVCYRPDGQAGIIGSMAGNCRYFNASENHLQLDSQPCLLGKKKLPGRGITSFQFLSQDSNKVMVTCAHSQVRILHEHNVIGKYKSLSGGSALSASFTSDGKHILSACEDSNVYLWNLSQDESCPTKVKKITSCERFFSNASVAIPWHGLKSQNTENELQVDVLDKRLPLGIRLSPPASFSLDQEFFLESFPKGSATWPEDKLPVSSSKAKTSVMHKSEYKFLKSSCKSTSHSHAWGMVIVTAGWDGRIKSFHNHGLPVLV